MRNPGLPRDARIFLLGVAAIALGGGACPTGLFDADGDGLSDTEENSGFIIGGRWEVDFPEVDRLLNGEPAPVATDPGDPDSDNDGLSDGDEIAFIGDVNNRRYLGTRRFRTDPTNPDTDLDGLTDAEDRSPLVNFDDFGTIVEFNQQDTDGDGVGDLQEADRDDDGFIDFRIPRQNDIGGLAFDAGTSTLFGVDSFNDQLITIDFSPTATAGVGTLVGDLGITDHNPSIQGLEFDPDRDVLYGSDVANDTLYEIDPATGQATVIGTIQDSEGIPFDFVLGLALDAENGVLYGVDNGTDQLITINTSTAEATVVGSLGFDFVNGLAFDPEERTLFATSIRFAEIVGQDVVFRYQLLSIDTTTGAAMAIGSENNDDVVGLAFDPFTGELFGTDIFTDQELRSINPATGTETLIGLLIFGEPLFVSERTMEQRFLFDFDGDGTLDGFDLNENGRIDNVQLVQDACPGIPQTNFACTCEQLLMVPPDPACLE